MQRLISSLNTTLERTGEPVTDHVLRATDLAGIGIWTADLEQSTTTCNFACCVLFGEVSPQSFDLQEVLTKFLLAEDLDNIMQAFKAANIPPSRSDNHVVFRLSIPGNENSWIKMSLSAMFAQGASTPSVLTAIFRDVTPEIEATERNDRLIQEMNHRVKNILSVVQSVAYQSFRHDIHSSGLFLDFQGRLRALAKTHELLVETDFAGTYLEPLATRIIQSCNAPEENVLMRGFPLHLGAKQAVSLGVVLHELCVNSLKYGSLSFPDGKVEVTWDRNEVSDMVKIRWHEIGGPTVLKPDEKGFGTRMIERAIALEFGGAVSLEFEPEGVQWMMTVPFKMLDQDKI